MAQPKRAADLLKGLMPELKAFSALTPYQDALDAALGAAKAPHCHVAGLRRGRLIVEVDSAPLYAELAGFARETLRQKLNEHVPKHPIAQLLFRMGGTSHA